MVVATCNFITIAMAIIGIPVYAIVLFEALIVLSIWFKEYILWFNKQYIKISAEIYARMVWILHIDNAYAWFTMDVVTTVAVQKWSSERSKLKDINVFKELVQNYKSTGRVVLTLNNIFRQ